MLSNFTGHGCYRWGAVFALLLALTAPAAGQDPQAVAPVTLTGVVLDDESGEPVADAVVSVPSRSMATLTREDGSFELSNVPGGVQVLRVRQLGYRELLRTLYVNPSVSELALRLERDPIPVAGLQVVVEGALSLTGTIVDGNSGAPMPGVFVWLAGEERGGMSDEGGSFRLDEVPTGPQLIQVEHVGYGRQFIPVRVTPPWNPISIVLQPDTDVLEGLPVIT